MLPTAAENIKQKPQNTLKQPRLYYLDWARVFAFSLLIVYHAGLIYTSWPWHIKSEVISPTIEHLASFITQWRIPLLFFISGGGTALAYKGQYLNFIKGRIQRVAIPLITSILFILPLQHLLERHWQGAPLEVLYANPLAYFVGRHPKGNFSFYHLWYLWDLWRMSILIVPILYVFNRYVSPYMGNRYVRYPIVGVFVLGLIFLKGAPSYFLIEYGIQFALGYLIFSNVEHFHLNKPILAIFMAGVSYGILVGYFWKYGYASMPPHIVHSQLLKWTYRFFLVINTMSMIYAIVSGFQTYFNYRNSVVTMINRVIVPIYVLHQILIMAIGYVFVETTMPPLVSFVVIQLIFWPLVLIICQVIQRFEVTRLLMGVR